MKTVEDYKWYVKRACNIHKQGDKPNIYIFSTARSGSSWLMEMLATQDGMKFINEPLLIDRLKNGNSPIPASWEFLLPNANREDALRKYFNELTSNKLGVGSPTPFTQFHRWFSDRVVFKILRCKDLMNWFEDEFNCQIIYLLRHPIPTNLSRSEYELLYLYRKNEEYWNKYLTKSQRKYCLSIIESGTEMQKKILDWCLQNLPPIRFLDRRNWLCLYYEDWVMNPQMNIQKTAEFLQFNDHEKILKQHARASGSTGLSDHQTKAFFDNPTGSDFLINKWRSKISDKEEQSLFEILQNLEIDVYEIGHDMPTNRL